MIYDHLSLRTKSVEFSGFHSRNRFECIETNKDQRHWWELAIIPFRIFVVYRSSLLSIDEIARSKIRRVLRVFSAWSKISRRISASRAEKVVWTAWRSIAASVSHEYIHKRRRRPTARVRDKDVNWWLGKRFPPLKIVLLAQDRRTPRHPPVQISFLSLPLRRL